MIFKSNCFLEGDVEGIPSKSYIHRALLAASLCEDESRINNVIYSDDVKATIEVIRTMGSSVQIEDEYILVKGFSNKRGNIFQCGESGTTLRLSIPIAAALGLNSTFDGKGRLVNRPIDEYIKVFDNQNIKYEYSGALPFSFEGQMKPGVFKIDGSVSSQYISGLLMALPILQEDSVIEIVNGLQSKSYIDITIEVLKSFGIMIEQNEETYYIKGNQKYIACEFDIENDYSQIAFWAVAATINGRIRIKDMKKDSKQGDHKIVEIIEMMGGNIYYENNDIIVEKSDTRCIELDVKNIPDLVPILTVLASLSKGQTVFYNTSRLKFKESDRGKAISQELGKIGGNIVCEDNKMIIEGVETFTEGLTNSWNDHRIAMSLAIASLKSVKNIEIENFNAIKKSYPHFTADFLKLGGEVIE
ncbi:MAG: 3-phosphoshikimate 1-carboxyvinyltransferase [Clostridiales bacterium]|nr:3-phosphoshikimate 1-carboxyvinyltransferase [Clostridiales bacterium]